MGMRQETVRMRQGDMESMQRKMLKGLEPNALKHV